MPLSLREIARRVQALKALHTISSEDALILIRQQAAYEDLLSSLKQRSSFAEVLTPSSVCIFCDVVARFFLEAVIAHATIVFSDGLEEVLPAVLVRPFVEPGPEFLLGQLVVGEESTPVIRPKYSELILKFLEFCWPAVRMPDTETIRSFLVDTLDRSEMCVVWEPTAEELTAEELFQRLTDAALLENPSAMAEELEGGVRSWLRWTTELVNVTPLPSYEQSLNLWRELYERALRENSLGRLDTRREIAVAYVQDYILRRSGAAELLTAEHCKRLVDDAVAECEDVIAGRRRIGGLMLPMSRTPDPHHSERRRVVLATLTSQRGWLVRFLSS
jgi:hypothetical protein